MQNSLAQIQIAPPGGFKGIGTLGNPGTNAIGLFTKFLSTAIGLITIIAFIWFLFNFILGAIAIISSGGDKTALEAAKKKIGTSITGLIVTIAAIFIVQLIGYLLGIDFLNLKALFAIITK